jgi:hypothetical protein
MVDTYQQPGAAQAANIVDKVSETFSITDFVPPAQLAAAKAGQVDIAPYAQAMLNQIAARGYGAAHFPTGKWVFGSAVGCYNSDLTISGDGPEATRLLCANPNGVFVVADQNGQAGHQVLLSIRDLTFVAANPGNNNNAVYFQGYPTDRRAIQAPGTPQVMISNVNWRSTGYGSDPTQPYWSGCLVMVDVSGVHMSNFHMVQIGNNSGNLLEINNESIQSAFKFDFVNYSIQGGLRCMYLHGWLEDINLANFEMAAVPSFGLVVDLSVNDGGQPQLPILSASGGHIYGTNNAISLKGINSAFLTNINSYLEPVPQGQPAQSNDQRQVVFESCTKVQVVNCNFEAGGNSNSGVNIGRQAIVMAIDNCEDALISNNKFLIKGEGSASTSALSNRCIQITGTFRRGSISGNIFSGAGPTPESGVFVQVSNQDERLSVKDNVFTDLNYMAVVVNPNAQKFCELDGYNIRTGVGVDVIGTAGAAFLRRNNVLN